MVAEKLWKQFYGVIIKNKVSIVAILLIAGSIILEAILDDVFVCPCVTSSEAIKACSASRDGNVTSNVDKYCVTSENIALSVLLMVAPAILLFMLSCLALSNWEGWIGCCSKCVEMGNICMNCCCRGFVTTILAPITWINLMLLDGNYVACMSTPRPYKLQNEVCLSEKSETYKYNYLLSKDIGLGCTLLSSIITLIVFWCEKCCPKKNYYEQKYERLRQELEDNEIDKFFREKGKKDAECLEKSLKKCRNEEVFNKILTARKANKPLFEILNDPPVGGDHEAAGEDQGETGGGQGATAGGQGEAEA